MRKIFIILIGLLTGISMLAKESNSSKKTVYTEAATLTLVGKIHDNTPIPYHRVDTALFKGFTDKENAQVRLSAGIAVAFRTNSTTITVKTSYAKPGFPSNTNGFSARGYDLYIKKDGKWIYAESGVAKDKELGKNYVLIKDMDDSMKECLLYLPLFSELKSVKIGTEKGSVIEALPMPFRHRIAAFGSSYTHGSGTSRSGMTYLAQLSRNTGLHFLGLGCSGNSRLQPYFCEVLCAAQADAFLLDAFTNPNPAQMKERLFPFIERLQQAHPSKPLIFSAPVYKEERNFNLKRDSYQQDVIDTADSLMKIAVKKYEHVYYIRPVANSEDHNATVDGNHPDNYGYTLWAKSIEKPLLKILKKYGIR
jgi:hypothetical protein